VAGVSVLLVLFHAWPILIPTVAVYILVLLPALPFTPAGLKRKLGGVTLADWIMTWFLSEATLLTLIGILFRGPGWAWTWPWRDGIY
jgi:quinol---cytochrome c reductase cytochrome c subunit, bacillus type